MERRVYDSRLETGWVTPLGRPETSGLRQRLWSDPGRQSFVSSLAWANYFGRFSLGLVRSTGFPADAINFHGNNKGRVELEEALDYGIGLVTVDSMYEIDLLDEVAREKGVTQQILLRVSPSIDGRTHLLTSTGVLDQKFGFPIETGQAEEAVRHALGKPNLDLAGVHFHLGSPIFELEPYTQAIPYVLEFVANMREHGLVQRIFSPGGGFAIGYVPGSPPPDISDYAAAISASVREACWTGHV